MGRRSPGLRQSPDLQEEETLYGRGFQRIAGVDEVGRGPLAGPVMAAAVVLPRGILPLWTGAIRDSKLLSPAKRERLAPLIREIGWVGVGLVEADAIDRVGILEATRQAMAQAVASLSPAPDFVLVDGPWLGALPVSQSSIKGGDGRCLSIAAASIVAKVARDRLMAEVGRLYPGYGFARHKGYGTAEHIRCLRELGPCPIHRRSFLGNFRDG